MGVERVGGGVAGGGARVALRPDAIRLKIEVLKTYTPALMTLLIKV